MDRTTAAGEDDARQGLPVKIVLVGDVAVGKTSLLVSYTTNGYPTEYVPTALDEYSVFVEADQQPIKLQLVDTAGQAEFRDLRQLCYSKADVILLCFSVVMPSSLRNCSDRWLREISDRLRLDKRPLPPLLLIGTQTDRRSDAIIAMQLQRIGEQSVSEERGHQEAAKLGAQQYLECSALTQRCLKRVFDEAVLAALRHKCKNHIVASIMLNAPDNSSKNSSLFPRLSPRSGRKLISKIRPPPNRAEVTDGVALALQSSTSKVNCGRARAVDGNCSSGFGKSDSSNTCCRITPSTTRASVSSASNSASMSAKSGVSDIVTTRVNEQLSLVAEHTVTRNDIDCYKKSDFGSTLSPAVERKNDSHSQYHADVSPTVITPVIHHHRLHDPQEERCRRSRRWKLLWCA